ncbi:hypothetical protein [Roseovarius sp.]|uniref:hypothetical protein n=1 Tax=Roseovarius sp. TaxID=1486281 RepID=UPI003BACC752
MLRRMVALSTLVPALLPGAAFACACCADPGTRFEQDVVRGNWEVKEISRLAPTSPARLYLTACGMECVKGVENPQPTYPVTFEASENGMVFELGEGDGTLTFPWPDAYTWFGADTALTGEGQTALYTELRFRGSVAGTGDFANGGATEAELVLSGQGNRCITARSFDAWSLTVYDDTTQYRLFGTLDGD